MAFPSGVIAYWRLDESSGDALDRIGTYTLTDTNTVARSAGKINNGADFVSANSEYFDGGDIGAFDFGTSDFAISLWFKTSTSGDAALISKITDTGQIGYAIRLRASDKIWVLQTDIASGSPVEVTFAYSTNTWHHLLLTRSGTTLKSYINGSETSSTTDSTNMSNTAAFRIGRLSGAYTTYFNGSIDEVGIWNRALTSGEVTTLYNAGSGLQPDLSTSLVSYWKLNESSGNAVDSVGSNTLTNNGTATYAAAKINNGVDFGATNSTKYLSNATNLGLTGSSDITISGWVNITTALTSEGQQYYLFSQGTTTTSAKSMAIVYRRESSVNKLVFYVETFPFPAGTTYNVTLTAGTWYHLVATKSSAGVVKLYLNGTEVISASPTFGANIYNNFVVGAGPDFGSKASASFDEVGIWSRAITVAEVTALYDSGNGNQYSFDTTPSATSLVSYWKLDESSGNAADSVGSLTLTNSNVTYSTGKVNNGAVFNSTTDSLVTNTITGVNFERTDLFTLQAWTNQTTLANAGYVISHIQSTANFPGYVLQIGSDGKIFFYLGNDNGGSNLIYVTTPVGTITTGAWYHIVVTYSGNSNASGLKIYVNGVNQSLTTVFNNLSASTVYSGPFQIGSREGNSINFAGTIDEVGIWSRVITGKEIYGLYNGGAGDQHPWPTGYTLDLSAGTFTLTGIDTLFLRLYQMVASAGSFILTGIDATFQTGYGLVMGTGSFILSGIDALFGFAGWTSKTKNTSSSTEKTKNLSSWTEKPRN